ncbi:hypothetical protein CKO28_07510 [Rhodovibrio sodomensis]|uniref:DUF29 domain-containing protein n=1 Tax=Rhodovibrio sodomensis TaxID=1088 RepID=A0ABS1DEP5_9PROT|nr:DUF29 domain-containing protein [Rhodovibrio sodomensis]MBK1667880.1 hypothetical protein [Rhodovibrio sodomensis]
MTRQRLYDTDFYAWTRDQAARLREVGDSRLDVENLAEEVAGLGRTELRAADSHLTQTLISLLKAAYRLGDQPQADWLNAADLHQDQARQAYWPSMRGKLDLSDAWRTAIRQTNRDLAAQDAQRLAADTLCPFSLDDLLSKDFDVDAAFKNLKCRLNTY